LSDCGGWLLGGGRCGHAAPTPPGDGPDGGGGGRNQDREQADEEEEEETEHGHGELTFAMGIFVLSQLVEGLVLRS
jgi:hypothetical protein